MGWRVWLVVVVLSSVASAQPVQTSEERSAAAKQYFETGMAHFQLDEYDRAIEAWENGFRIKPVSQFLYNIGQAHRLAKHYEKALSFYKKYLYMDAKAPNRVEVERQIATLTRLIDDQGKASSAPPTQPLVGEIGRTRQTTKPTKPEPVPVAIRAEPVPAPTPTVVVAHEADNRPLTKKPWFWGVVGGAAVVVVAAVVIGVVVGTGSDAGRTLPGVSF